MHLHQLKGTTHMQGTPFVNRKYTKGKQASSVEKVYKRVRGWTSGGASPYKTLLSTPLKHHPRPNPTQQKLWKSQKCSTATTSMNFSHRFGRVACSRLQVSWENRSRKVALGSGACNHCFQWLIHVHTGIPYDWYVLTVNINTYVNHLALHVHSCAGLD